MSDSERQTWLKSNKNKILYQKKIKKLFFLIIIIIFDIFYLLFIQICPCGLVPVKSISSVLWQLSPFTYRARMWYYDQWSICMLMLGPEYVDFIIPVSDILFNVEAVLN